jgi:hypothetical protein
VNRCTICSELLAQSLIARSAREDRAWKPLPSSLTHRRKACLLVRSSRTAPRDPGRASLAKEERRRSLLLSRRARDSQRLQLIGLGAAFVPFGCVKALEVGLAAR